MAITTAHQQGKITAEDKVSLKAQLLNGDMFSKEILAKMDPAMATRVMDSFIMRSIAGWDALGQLSPRSPRVITPRLNIDDDPPPTLGASASAKAKPHPASDLALSSYPPATHMPHIPFSSSSSSLSSSSSFSSSFLSAHPQPYQQPR